MRPTKGYEIASHLNLPRLTSSFSVEFGSLFSAVVSALEGCSVSHVA